MCFFSNCRRWLSGPVVNSHLSSAGLCCTCELAGTLPFRGSRLQIPAAHDLIKKRSRVLMSASTSLNTLIGFDLPLKPAQCLEGRGGDGPAGHKLQPSVLGSNSTVCAERGSSHKHVWQTGASIHLHRTP